jgi:hypothetical protein
MSLSYLQACDPVRKIFNSAFELLYAFVGFRTLAFDVGFYSPRKGDFLRFDLL